MTREEWLIQECMRMAELLDAVADVDQGRKYILQTAKNNIVTNRPQRSRTYTTTFRMRLLGAPK